MHIALANMLIYIYDNLYSQSRIKETLSLYSDAIMDALAPGSSLYALYLTIRSVGFGILAVYFIIALGTRMEGRETSPTVIFQTLLQFFVGYALALLSFDMVKWFFQLGDALAALIAESTTNGNSLAEFGTALANSLDDTLDLTSQVMYIMKALLPWLGCVATQFIITYAVVSRVIRICVNAVLSPIAVANFFDGSRHADGVHFIKKTFAMCLQCAAIMVIIAGMSSITRYMAYGATYHDDLSTSAVKESYDKLLDSTTNDFSAVNVDVNYAVDKIGTKAYKGNALKKRYSEARDALLSKDIGKVTSTQEAKYKKYERDLGIEVFARNGSSYIYNSDGYAILNDKYITFSSEEMSNFLLTVIGSGNGFWIFLMLLVVKVGLIKQSMSLCNVIVGV